MAGQGNSIAPAKVSSVSAELFGKLAVWGNLVRFSHTIFALPFALSMVVYLSREHSLTMVQVGFLVLCVVTARTAAMSFNRLVDRAIDAQNPRTSGRELPSGKLSPLSVIALCALSSSAFVAFAAGLGRHCLLLAPAVLLLLFCYSLTKRFTSAAHFVLGIALACAPGGVWYAITEQFAWLPVWMMAGVLFWVAGFDIFYSLQDMQFDRAQGLFSIPARFGASGAFNIARISHVLAVLSLAGFSWYAGLGGAAWTGLFIFSLLLLNQHIKISPERMESIESTFFTRNAWASIVYFLGIMVDRVIR